MVITLAALRTISTETRSPERALLSSKTTLAGTIYPQDSWGRLETIALATSCSVLNPSLKQVLYTISREGTRKTKEEEGVDSFIVGRVNEEWVFRQR